MKKIMLAFPVLLILCLDTHAQSEIFTNDDLLSPGEKIIYRDGNLDYYGIVKNGMVSSVYAKDKKTGKKEDIVFNGRSADGKMIESENNPNSDTPVVVMAKNEGTVNNSPKCKGYQKYSCEIIVGRDPATGTTITRQGECVREVEVDCPKNPAKKAVNSIKAAPVTTKSK